ncbi:MAG: glycoside hydrolase family 3 C-terminal domain-containing protein [Oscillospiraceae bacterium]|nr:glycoside hydrolase family 3 C-terminal domain-containing protein [Oscillospiraceae bacterium]
MDFSTAREKAISIVSKMTAEEKMSQLLYNAAAIERLGINEHNWWNEACHGVARAGVATVFPQTIGLSASFNPKLVNSVADAISTEGRAKYNSSIKYGDRGIYKGLTYWSPNINIFRDSRWGRGQETFGEDPFLTAVLGCAFIKGLQGNGEFLKAAACAKHFAVHSGPEKLRHSFNADANEKDLYETYLPAFEYAVKANVAGVMGAYNRTNGEPCCASKRLIQDILRTKWGFNGYFVSDCGAIADISKHHGYAENLTQAAALALKAGCNLNCGEAYEHLIDAYEEDLIDEDDITDAAVRLYTTRVLLGEFEENRPYADIPYSKLNCPEHKMLNLEAARQSIVLLKNESKYLPVRQDEVKRIAVIGPNALSTIALEGNYNGHADEYITVADGIRKVFDGCEVIVADGSQICFDKSKYYDGFNDLESEAAAAASQADITVLCLGLDRHIEGEDTGCENDFTDHGDKKTLYLPETQMKLADAVCKACDNLIVVTMCGSAVDLGEKVRNHAKAIIHAWYPGALGGLAIAQLLAGMYSPSGRLPITFYNAKTELPDITNYNMSGRTYRFIKEKPLYPFGYGLSFAEFEYSNFEIPSFDDSEIKVNITLTNKGNMKAYEKIQIYAQYTDSRTDTPNYQLCLAVPLELNANETKSIEAKIDRYWIKAVLADGTRTEPNGKIILYAGGHQPDEYSESLYKYHCIKAEVR